MGSSIEEKIRKRGIHRAVGGIMREIFSKEGEWNKLVMAEKQLERALEERIIEDQLSEYVKKGLVETRVHKGERQFRLTKKGLAYKG